MSFTKSYKLYHFSKQIIPIGTIEGILKGQLVLLQKGFWKAPRVIPGVGTILTS